MILEAKALSLIDRLGLTQILNHVSFQIETFDRVAVLGTSGSGKTSLLRLLNRLTEPTTGTVFFEGKPYNNIPVISLRKQIVLVPQEPKLLGMNVREALSYPLKLQQLSPTEIKTRITTYCEPLHIPESWYDKNELQLSLGQRQLVTIARGLIMQPKVLLLDEPTAALDLGIATQLIEFLKKQEMTILMVNHQLDIAEIFCNRVLYLEKGTLIQDRDNFNLSWQELKQNIIDREAEIEADFE